MRFIEEKFVPVATRIGTQRHLIAIRDAFIVIMPVTIVGAIAVLVNNIHAIFAPTGLNIVVVQEAYANFIANTGIRDVMIAVNRGSINMMSILLVAVLGYKLAVSLKGDGIATTVVSMTCYLGLIPSVSTFIGSVEQVISEEIVPAAGGVAANKLDSNGMFVGMLLTIVVAEIFVRLSKNEKLKITLPDGVPPAVASSFTVLIPAVITVLVVVAVGTYIYKLSGLDIWDIVFIFVSTPLNNVADTVGTAVLVMFLISLLWAFGLHGGNIVGSVTTPIFTPLAIENTAAFEAGKEIPNVINGVQSFAAVGGAGCTLGFVIAVLLFGKTKSERTVVGISVAPGLFQINEPLLFGIPIVMNPIYMIPFIVCPVVLAIASYICMSANIIERVCISVPWITPPVLVHFLSTGGGIKATIFAIVSIPFITLVWIPFVIASNKMNSEK